jgi:pyruvate,water dikinase
VRTSGERLAALPAIARAYAKIAIGFFRMDTRVATFFDELAAAQAELARRPLAERDPHELLDLVESLLSRLMPEYAVSPLNDSFAQQLHEALGKLIERYRLGDPHTLRNGLLCGEAGMESVAPVRSVLALTETIRRSPFLRELFERATPPAEVWRAIHDDATHAAFRAELAEHLRKYGDRMVQELKLETPTVEDNPGFVVETLRNYLAGGQSADKLSSREEHLRDEAEQQVRRALRFHPLRRRLFGYVLRRLRHAVRDRENLRFARTRVIGMARRIYHELGRRFAAAGLLSEPRDIFYLTCDEVASYLRGQAVTQDAASLVALRKVEYAELAARRPDARITTYGIVYANDLSGSGAAARPGAQVLRGLGASPGRVEAAAKVVLDPANDTKIRGEVLIAPNTDPGWVFLMVAAAGLVAEKGSLLSHTAIIGRELGIPTVVGVRDATRLVRSGQRVVLDGAAGTVTLVDAQSGRE